MFRLGTYPPRRLGRRGTSGAQCITALTPSKRSENQVPIL